MRGLRIRYLLMVLPFAVFKVVFGEAGPPLVHNFHERAFAIALDAQPAQTPQTWTITHMLEHESGVTEVAISPSG